MVKETCARVRRNYLRKVRRRVSPPTLPPAPAPSLSVPIVPSRPTRPMGGDTTQDNCSKLFELNLSPRLRYPCSCLLTPAVHALL